jgi:c-di-GMP-binding flagellar brake protein YcgR
MQDNKRRYGRFDTELKARYRVAEKEGDWKTCTVVNLSRKGIGIQLHAHETIDLDTVIRLEVFVPEKSQPTSVQGIVKWTEERGDNVFCGIESIELLDEMKFSKMD